MGFETAEVIRERVYRNRSDAVRKITDKSPFLASVVTLTDSGKTGKGKRQQGPAKSPKTPGTGVEAGTSAVFSGEGSLEESSGEFESSQDEEEDEEEEDDDVIAKPQADVAHDTDEDSLAELKRLSRKETSQVLEKLGFDDERSTRLPNLGTITFDPKTGRRIIHKGSNRWEELNNPGVLVSLDKYEKLQWELELRENIEKSNREIANNSNSNNNSAILSAPYNLSHKSKVHQSKSGMISISNPHVVEGSLFLEQHKAAFLQEYSHHSLTDHNRTGADGDEDSDEDREFNYKIPSLRTGGTSTFSPNKTSPGGVGGGGSFITGLELDRSNPAEYLTSEEGYSPQRLSPSATSLGGANHSLVLLGNPKGYTEVGIPIRGARKPKGKNMNKLIAAAEAATGFTGATGTVNSKSLGYGPGFKPPKARSRKPRYKGTKKETADDGTTAASTLGVDSVWQNSSWGQLKKKVNQRAKDPAVQVQVLQHVMNNTDIGRLDVSGRGPSTLDSYLSDSDAEGDADSIRRRALEVDSDEEMRSRNIYKPKKKIVAKVVVWPQKPLKNYRLKYTWLPQPMLHNAVNNLYYDKSVADFYLSKQTTQEDHYQTDLNREKPRYIQTVNQLNMMNTVSTAYAPVPPSEFTDLEVEGDEGESRLSDSQWNHSGSYSPVSTKHPERQAEVPLTHLPKVRVTTVPKHGPDSVSQPQEASTMVSSVTSFQDSNMSVGSSISKYSYPANKYRPEPPSVDPTVSTVKSSLKRSTIAGSTADKKGSTAVESPLRPHSIHRYNSMNTIAEDTKSIVSPDFMETETPFASNHYESSTERYPEEQHTDPTSSRKFKFKFNKSVSFKKNASIHPYEFY